IAPKSNASYRAVENALAEVRQGPARAVPDHLRDRHRPGAEDYPAYVYPHDHPHGSVTQQYLPDGLEGTRFFEPGDRGWEAEEAGDSQEPV
ncbi:MAG: replication-associated recombination protein A, partial [Coriobacteriia bacterium]|nr:replication-associated recombination protein A [Coriobacteriia bacterium]